MYIRVKSHRARQALEDELGRLPQGYFSFWFDGEFRLVTEDKYEKVKGIKGISRARIDESKLHQCWSNL